MPWDLPTGLGFRVQAGMQGPWPKSLQMFGLAVLGWSSGRTDNYPVHVYSNIKYGPPVYLLLFIHIYIYTQ